MEAAIRGMLDSWENKSKSCLELIIVLAQLLRKIHRITPEASSGDVEALRLS